MPGTIIAVCSVAQTGETTFLDPSLQKTQLLRKELILFTDILAGFTCCWARPSKSRLQHCFFFYFFWSVQWTLSLMSSGLDRPHVQLRQVLRGVSALLAEVLIELLECVAEAYVLGTLFYQYPDANVQKGNLLLDQKHWDTVWTILLGLLMLCFDCLSQLTNIS